MNKNLLLFIFIYYFTVNSFGQYEFSDDGFTVMENNNTSQNVRLIKEFDADGDGDIDLLSASDGKIKWFENTDGHNTNIISHDLTETIGHPSYITTTDIDSDGDKDIIMHISSSIFLIENIDGLGNFELPIVLFSNSEVIRGISVIDLDTDGDMDIVYSHREFSDVSSLKWLENTDGLGSFLNNIVIEYDHPRTMFCADVDNDNDIDILAYQRDNFTSEVIMYENDGMQNFTQHTITTANDNGYATILAKDIDNDNDLDLIVTDSEGFSNSIMELRILKNDSFGSFTEYQIIVTNVTDISYLDCGDLDADGDLDIIFSSYENHSATWVENIDGLGTYSNPEVINNNARGANSIVNYDFDNDGDIDLVSSSQLDDKIAWYENIDGLGDFDEERVLTSSINYPVSSITGDIDGDNDLDIIYLSENDNKIAWHENLDGLGNFGKQKLIDSREEVEDYILLDILDIDNDGDLDILSKYWYENIDGLGNFERRQLIGSGIAHGSTLSIADLDNDGDNELIYILGQYPTSEPAYIVWKENLDGHGDFGDPNRINLPFFPQDNNLLIADINSDDYNDIVIQGNLAAQTIWYLNDGAGNFIENIINSDYERGLSCNIGDFDNDGDIDIVSAYEESGISGNYQIGWYENLNGQGDFSNIQVIDDNIPDSEFNNYFRIEIYTEDVNGDGNLDILSRTESKVAWYEGIDGLGNFFNEKILFEENIQKINSIHLADLNGDWDKDLIITNSVSSFSNDYYLDRVIWYENLGLGSNEINGQVKLDLESDGCDSLDLPLSGVMVITDNGEETLATFTTNAGYYQLFPNMGSYTTSVVNTASNYYNTNPNTYNHNFTDVGNSEEANFCSTPIDSIDDLAISIIPTSQARPGFDASYQIIYKNIGTTVLNGEIEYQYDNNKLDFLYANETISSQTANRLTFDFSNLAPFETRTIDLIFDVFTPPTVNIDDVLLHLITMTPSSGDIVAFGFNQIVIGSYDPNDILVLEGDKILIEDIDEYLHYVIRFQNTGTASAINVKVENILDNNLDWSTMQLENLSHPGRVEIRDGSQVEFIFEDIYLPDSMNDEPNSHGYIAYKIKPKSSVVLGDIISNTAEIFFDFNPPIVTNTVMTKVVSSIELADDDFSMTTINGSQGGITPSVLTNDLFNDLEVNPSDVVVSLVDENSSFIINSDGTITILPGTQEQGVYTVEYEVCEANCPTNCDTATATLMLEVLSANEFDTSGFSIYPNPVSNELYITSDKNIDTLKVLDLNGRQLINKSQIAKSNYQLDTSELSSGVYFIQVTVEGINQIQKFIVK